MQQFIITDIDGTLAHSAWREHLIAESWDTFHAAASEDQPNKALIDLIEALNPAKVDFIAVTGRNEKWRQLTSKWLWQHNVPIDELLMRANDDYRPAPIVKFELAEAFFQGKMKEQLLGVFDDDEKVLEQFAAAGIMTFHVRLGK